MTNRDFFDVWRFNPREYWLRYWGKYDTCLACGAAKGQPCISLANGLYLKRENGPRRGIWVAHKNRTIIKTFTKPYESYPGYESKEL